MSNFIQTNAENFAEAFSEQIAAKAVEVINTIIDLKTLVDEENAKLKAEFDEAMSKVPEEDKELYKDHTPETVKLDTQIEKFEFAFKQLIKAGYTLNHDELPNGEVVISIYKLESKHRYKFKSTYSVGLEQLEA